MPKQLLIATPNLNIAETEIQGDVLIGLQKVAQIFLVFTINDLKQFKLGLRALIPSIATTRETRLYELAADTWQRWKKDPNKANLPEPPQPADVVKTNVAFTALGLAQLNISTTGADESFVAGMNAIAPTLGDNVAADWRKPYVQGPIHGVFLIAAWAPAPNGNIAAAATAAKAAAAARLAAITALFTNAGSTAFTIVVTEEGLLNQAAPGHEAFGFADGVSQPAVEGLHRAVAAKDQSFPGQDIVKLGDFILGNHDKEIGGKSTPPQDWMENGSYLVFRRLQQDVALFDSYTQDPKNFTGLAASGTEFAAKIVGRWKDGTPIARNPLDPLLPPAAGTMTPRDENAPFENNDFEFGVQKVAQSRCPFNAHIRRVYPRSDVQDGDGNAEKRRILRAGIAFDQGAEGKPDEGLLFVCYQSSIVEKFDFIQTAWANSDSIPFVPPYIQNEEGTLPAKPGIDLVIGQGPLPRDAHWDGGKHLKAVPKFVTATGGGYFFSPSISGLKTIAAP